MPTTALGLRYPASTSAVDVPTDIGNLASDVDAKLTVINTFITRKDGVQSANSISSSAAIGTTATAVLTLTGCVFTANRAYSVENVGLVFGDAAGRLADFSVFKTSTAGTQYVAFGRSWAGVGGQQTTCYSRAYVIRSAGTDLTTDIVLSVASTSAGTVQHDAASTRPRALIVRDVGTSAAYSWCLAVT